MLGRIVVGPLRLFQLHPRPPHSSHDCNIPATGLFLGRPRLRLVYRFELIRKIEAC